MDVTNSLFEHIRNRLPTGYNYGDDGTIMENKVPNHKTFQQSIREDHPGDVGIFELNISRQPTYSGYSCLIAEVQIVVVVNNDGIEKAKQYLTEAFENIKDAKNKQSTNVFIRYAKLVNIIPLGKNSNNLQMVEMTLNLKYLINSN